MSVLLATDGYATIRPVLERLRQQTVRDRLEIVLVYSEPDALKEEVSELAGFAAVQLVEVSPGTSLAHARSVGIRSSTGATVFIGETHSYPHPGMAEALLVAHRQGWDVAVPAFGNANPDGLASCSNFMFDYGRWRIGLPAQPLDGAPTYNVSYTREVLLDLGERLETALSHGDEMSRFLDSTTRRIVFVPDARIDHLNLSRTSDSARERFLAGLLIGGERSLRWGWARRSLYCAASPLIAAVLATRTFRALRATRDRDSRPRGILAAVLWSAAFKAAGEAVGYVRGPSGRASEGMDELELHKLRYVRR